MRGDGGQTPPQASAPLPACRGVFPGEGLGRAGQDPAGTGKWASPSRTPGWVDGWMDGRPAQPGEAGAGSALGIGRPHPPGFPALQSQGSERMWEGQLPSWQLLPGKIHPHICHWSFPSSGQSGERRPIPGGWALLTQWRPRPPDHPFRRPPGPSAILASPTQRDQSRRRLCCGPPAAACWAPLPPLPPRASPLPSAQLVLEQQVGTRVSREGGSACRG